MTDSSKLLEELCNDNIDFIVMEEVTSNNMRNVMEEITSDYLTDAGDGYAVVIEKSNTQLLADVNKALTELKSEGVLEELTKKWTDTSEQGATQPNSLDNAIDGTKNNNSQQNDSSKQENGQRDNNSQSNAPQVNTSSTKQPESSSQEQKQQEPEQNKSEEQMPYGHFDRSDQPVNSSNDAPGGDTNTGALVNPPKEPQEQTRK